MIIILLSITPFINSFPDLINICSAGTAIYPRLKEPSEYKEPGHFICNIVNRKSVAEQIKILHACHGLQKRGCFRTYCL